MRKSLRLVAVVLAVAMGAAACGDDDGDAVRETGEASGSASASASGSGSASASGSASGSGTASGTEECHVEGGTTDAATSEVHAELAEYTITLAEKSVKAGKVKFEADNTGEEPHEIAIVRTDDVTKLPLDDDGAAEEGDALVGEIEPFAAGTECEGTFELAAGNYAIICNIVEEEADGTTESHFKEGMYTTLTVTA
jgi:hypothetical protein